MKSKLMFIIVVAVALVGGFFAGAYRERVAYDHIFMRSAYLHAAIDTEQQVRVLTYLREGRPRDARDTLEIFLDSSLTAFAHYDEAPPCERGDFVPRAIRVAQEYREKHPPAASPGNTDTTVHDVHPLRK